MADSGDLLEWLTRPLSELSGPELVQALAFLESAEDDSLSRALSRQLTLCAAACTCRTRLDEGPVEHDARDHS